MCRNKRHKLSPHCHEMHQANGLVQLRRVVGWRSRLLCILHTYARYGVVLHCVEQLSAKDFFIFGNFKALKLQDEYLAARSFRLFRQLHSVHHHLHRSMLHPGEGCRVSRGKLLALRPVLLRSVAESVRPVHD